MMKLNKKLELFPWFENVYVKLQESFGFRNEEAAKSALETLLEYINLEMESLLKRQDTQDRADMLLNMMKDCLLYFHLCNSPLKEDSRGIKCLYVKVLSCFLDLCVYLSEDSDSSHLNSAFQQLFLSTENEMTDMWDVLLHCSLLKKVHAEAFCPILKRVLSLPIAEDLEPKQYLKFLLLCRLWKVFTSDVAEKRHIKTLVTKVKVPQNFYEFLSTFPIPEISIIASHVKRQKIAAYFLIEKFPKNVLQEAKQMLRDETVKYSNESTVLSPVLQAFDANEPLFCIDTASKFVQDDIPEDLGSYDFDFFPNLPDSQSLKSEQSDVSIPNIISDLENEKDEINREDTANFEKTAKKTKKNKKSKRNDVSVDQESDSEDKSSGCGSRKSSFLSNESENIKQNVANEQISYSESDNSARKKHKKSKKRISLDSNDSISDSLSGYDIVKELSSSEALCETSYSENDSSPRKKCKKSKKRKLVDSIGLPGYDDDENDVRVQDISYSSRKKRRSENKEKSFRDENDSFCLRLDSTADDSKHIDIEMSEESMSTSCIQSTSTCDQDAIAFSSSKSGSFCKRKPSKRSIAHSSNEEIADQSIMEDIINVSSLSFNTQSHSSEMLNDDTENRCKTWLKECEGTRETSSISALEISKDDSSHDEDSKLTVESSSSVTPMIQENEPTSTELEAMQIKKVSLSNKGDQLSSSKDSSQLVTKHDLSNDESYLRKSRLSRSRMSNKMEFDDSLPTEKDSDTKCSKAASIRLSPTKKSRPGSNSSNANVENDHSKDENDCRYVKCLYPGQDLPTLKYLPETRSQRLSKKTGTSPEKSVQTSKSSPVKSCESSKEPEEKQTRTPRQRATSSDKSHTDKKAKLEESVCKLVKAKSSVSSPMRVRNAVSDVLASPLRKSLRLKINCATPLKNLPNDTTKSRRSPRKSPTPLKLPALPCDESESSEFHTPSTSECETSEFGTPAKKSEFSPSSQLELGFRRKLYVDMSKNNAVAKMNSSKRSEKSTRTENAERNVARSPDSQRNRSEPSERSPSKGKQKDMEYALPRSPGKKYNLRTRTCKTPWKNK